MSFNKCKLAVAVAAAASLTFSPGAFATNGIIQAGNGMVAHGLVVPACRMPVKPQPAWTTRP